MAAVRRGLFKDFNKPFGGPTGFEWLSRDAAEVDTYVKDPLCGFAFTNELTRDTFVGFARMRDPALEARIAKTMPVLVIPGRTRSGGREPHRHAPPGGALPGAGAPRIETRYYTGARHEWLNETNRDQVTTDVLG